MQENELIPYSATEIAAERALTLSAHPDDDVFGAGGLLARLARSAEAVRAIVMTGGEAQEPAGAGSADPGTRRKEAQEAAGMLGIGDVAFWELPDRGLARRREEIVGRLRREIAAFRPDLVIAPSPCEIHPDHRAVAEAVYEVVAGARPEDAEWEILRFVRIAFYEITQPILPNALVPLGDLAETKRRAIARFPSQAAVRDYAGAVEGLNAFRGLTLDGAGPAESFRVVSALEASAHSLAELRREIGPAAIAAGDRAVAPAAVVVRTRNRPALLREALESLSAQSARPRSVVVVNDGGAPVEGILAPFSSDYGLTHVAHSASRGRSAAANAGVERVSADVVGFLDDDDVLFPDHFERLLAARAAGPEPIAYSDAVTVLLEREGEGWAERHRELQYSLDFDPEYLLYANYIPLHTVLFDTALLRRAGGFDPALDYSEDWDLLIRLSFETPFRHVRGVTAAYRIFSGETGHVEAGGGPFVAAREKILERYGERRSDGAAARVLDRLSRRLWEVSRREYRAEGELGFQRASHRRLSAELDAVSAERHALRGEAAALEGERARLEGELLAGLAAWEKDSTALYAEI
ncbi:MAG TPA: PIG-L family deacetylase, partial [Thermoanaerobaculia bacterium]|nr:PIG-L family deacetylase [Thermoanaerobaculia bacterium]